MNNVNCNMDNVSANADNARESCDDSAMLSDSRVDEIVKFYESNIGTVSPYAYEILNSYRDTFSDDIIIHAMKLSVEAGAKNIKYIKAILNSWQKANIKSLVDAKNESKRTSKSQSYKDTTTNQYDNLSKFYMN